MKEKIQKLLEEVMDLIKAAAEQRDISRIGKLSEVGNELRSLNEQIEAISIRVTSIEENLVHRKPEPRRDLRMLFCQTTGGSLRQNLLTVTRPIHLGLLSVGEKLEIELPNGARFETDVVEEGKKLRERGLIAKFYKDYHVREGEYVVLEERETGKWKLRKAYPGEHQNW